MWRLGPMWEDESTLAATWRAAQPFPHLVFDDFTKTEALSELVATADEEPIQRYDGDIFAFEASSPEVRTESFRRLRDAFASLLAPPLSRITGKTVRRVDMRAYAYGAGHYLLPHTDHRDGVGRALAYAYYLPSPELFLPPIPPETQLVPRSLRGGELELYACRAQGGELVSTDSARIIEPVSNRLVVFDVSDVSLHQVREVLAGRRISLSGWFYP
jgi:hypothetical protein